MKSIGRWLVPAAIVTVLLLTLGMFKRMEDVTKDESQKIQQYTNNLK
ncbi:branched-subunit amino acid permease [Bacillus sp. RC242]